MVMKPGHGDGGEEDGEDFKQAFVEQYKQEFGFVLDKPIMVDDIRIRGVGKSFDTLGKSVWDEMSDFEGKWKKINREGKEKEESKRAEVFFEVEGRIEVPVYLLEKLVPGEVIDG